MSVFSKTILFSTVFFLVSCGESDAAEFKLDRRIHGGAGGGYVFNDNTSVCEAYEKNLNKFASEPHGMACGRKLDPTLGFIRVKWKKLDIMKHGDLIRDIIRANKWMDKKQLHEISMSEYLNDLIKKVKPELEVTQVDLDGDGKTDNVIRYRLGACIPCNPENKIKGGAASRKSIAVVDKKFTKVESTAWGENDIFIYKDRVYSDELVISDKTRIYLYNIKRDGYGIKCRFEYIDNNNTGVLK